MSGFRMEGPDPWKRVILRWLSEDRHPDLKSLGALIRWHGVPADEPTVREYVARRLGAPGTDPIRPGSGRTYTVDPNPLRDALSPDQDHQHRLYRLQRRHERYQRFTTRQEPSKRNLPRCRFVEARGLWKLKSPKAEALRQVARRSGLSESYLEALEKEFRRPWADPPPVVER